MEIIRRIEMQIEKNVPYDARNRFCGINKRRSSYPFMEMEVGDSVIDEGAIGTATSKAYQVAKKYSQRSGDRKFSASRVDGGVRIWRVA